MSPKFQTRGTRAEQTKPSSNHQSKSMLHTTLELTPAHQPPPTRIPNHGHQSSDRSRHLVGRVETALDAGDGFVRPLSLNDGLYSSRCRRFQALLKTFEQLSGLILDCLRVDVRCRSIHYLECAMKEAGFTVKKRRSVKTLLHHLKHHTIQT